MKNYICISFMMMLLSYLSPREEYKRYFQFIISLLLIVIIIKPAVDLIFEPSAIADYIEFEEVKEKLETDISEAYEFKKN